MMQMRQMAKRIWGWVKTTGLAALDAWVRFMPLQFGGLIEATLIRTTDWGRVGAEGVVPMLLVGILVVGIFTATALARFEVGMNDQLRKELLSLNAGNHDLYFALLNTREGGKMDLTGRGLVPDVDMLPERRDGRGN